MIADPRLNGIKIINDRRTRGGYGLRVVSHDGIMNIYDDHTDAYHADVPQDDPPKPGVKVIIDRARFERLLTIARHAVHPNITAPDGSIFVEPGDLDPIP